MTFDDGPENYMVGVEVEEQLESIVQTHLNTCGFSQANFMTYGLVLTGIGF